MSETIKGGLFYGGQDNGTSWSSPQDMVYDGKVIGTARWKTTPRSYNVEVTPIGELVVVKPPEPAAWKIAPGLDVMVRLSPVEEQRGRISRIDPERCTLHVLIVATDGTLGAERTFNHMDVFEGRIRVVDPAPSTAAPETRGRARLKPGHSI